MRSREEMAAQLDLLSWTSPQTKPARRTTTRGLEKDVRIAVRRSETRSADRGTVEIVFEDLTPPMVRYRSDRNGGSYDVRVDQVKKIPKPRIRATASY